MERVILFGAGAAGRYVLAHGTVEVVAFADNDMGKWGMEINGIPILSPDTARAIEGVRWVASIISPPARQVREQMKEMGVATKPLWECLPVCHGLGNGTIRRQLCNLVHDNESYQEVVNQFNFRANPDYDRQRPAAPIGELYFPPFITKREDEHFVDCGAADGDTLAAFRRWQPLSRCVTAFEPDPDNFAKLLRSPAAQGAFCLEGAVGGHFGQINFTSTGDYSSHIDSSSKGQVQCYPLDDVFRRNLPTFIKMDIEGSELEALWGARRILAEHRPVLAICAYHKSEDLWQIPLLIQLIQPEYKFFLRRYAEGAFELVWYAVPEERIVR